MSSLNPYLAMVHGVQALRRRVERDNSAILGALGVAADALPHQVANVVRILKATELRFFIADGVGLGKTIQTLMVLNALRLRNPEHRALMVVPDHLVKQWLEELATRGHISAQFIGAVGESDELPADELVRLVRPSELLNSPELLREGPDTFDMLILDEPQTFTRRQRNALARARPFAQFLALTATPDFHRREMRDWFIRMIEPLRAGAQGDAGDPLDRIQQDESLAHRNVENGSLSLQLAFERDALGRRICRWARKEWPDYMPQRLYSRSDVAIFRREAALAAQAKTLVNRHLRNGNDGEGQNVDLIRRARALHRVGRSARDAVVALNLSAGGVTDEPEVRGDSRFDALLSHLARVWSRDREARVLIVAGDNYTVERLTRRLQDFFTDAATAEPLGVASLARGDEGAGSAEAAVWKSHGTLDTFVNGDDRVLLIGDWAEAGLNLHHSCSEIVFYSCPWDVRSVDQLVGRLDRLRRNAGRRAHEGKGQGKVRLHVVSWANSPEARVIDGLEQLGVFEYPAPMASEETGNRIAELLQGLAAGRNVASSLEELKSYGAEQAFESALSRLAHFSPYTPQAARKAHATRVADTLVPGSLGKESGKFGRTDEESSLKEWLETLCATHLLDFRFGIRGESDERYSTAWYADTGVRHQAHTRPFLLDVFERRSEGDTRANAASGMVGFNLHRHHLADPPRRFIGGKDGRSRTLDFVDHGDRFHDQLWTEFLAIADRTLGDRLQDAVVEFPSGHAALNDRRPMLITASMRAGQLPVLSPERIEKALSHANEIDRSLLRRTFTAMAAADERWFVLNCPPRLSLDGAYRSSSGSEWEAATEQEVLARLDPRANVGRGAQQRLNSRPQPLAGVDAEVRRRRAESAAIPTKGVKQETIDLRLGIVEGELARFSADASRRAREVRNRIGEGEVQRRLTEGQAQRIDSWLQSIREFFALRSARIMAANSPEVSPEERCWQVIIYPTERR